MRLHSASPGRFRAIRESAAAGPVSAPAHVRASTTLARPPIRWKRIPFSKRRKREMALYSKRHYGKRQWRLVHPKVIVEHFTGGESFRSAWNTFAANSRDLGELPGTCAHFIVDRDGTIYQLVHLSIRCRHTVGLNYTAIGIEDVGKSDREILRNHAQLRSALRLTLWLMSRFHIALGDVIGHNESLRSPYHHELYRSWRCQTHSDWTHADMKVFRRKLLRRARRFNAPVKPLRDWVKSRC